MSAAPELELDESRISEPMSWEEICARYPDEWVCLVETDWVCFNDFHFRTARVLCHSKKRDEPLEEAKSWWWRYRQIGHFFTGKVIAYDGPREDWEYTGEVSDDEELSA
jgi:hypothetical protein